MKTAVLVILTVLVVLWDQIGGHAAYVIGTQVSALTAAAPAIPYEGFCEIHAEDHPCK